MKILHSRRIVTFSSVLPKGALTVSGLAHMDQNSPQKPENVCPELDSIPNLGGFYRPAKCRSRWKVAIIVPFRNRTAQLATFLRYMVPFLQKQLLEFGIFIVNQENVLLFNRGMLMNTGFLESQHFSTWDCYIVHDVDLIPQSELNSYGCIHMPRHFVSGADNRNYRLPYSSYFGGVVGFKADQFRHINGFSNVYWGWCCEDDDLSQRVNTARLRTNRYNGHTGYYKAITRNHIRSANNSAGQREK